MAELHFTFLARPHARLLSRPNYPGRITSACWRSSRLLHTENACDGLDRCSALTSQSRSLSSRLSPISGLPAAAATTRSQLFHLDIVRYSQAEPSGDRCWCLVHPANNSLRLHPCSYYTMSQSPQPMASEPQHPTASRPDSDHHSSHDDQHDHTDLAASAGHDDEDGLTYGYDFEIKEQDRWLPIANG